MISLYIVMEIGCIECGEGSRLIGLFLSKRKADAFAESHEPVPRYGGEIRVEVFRASIGFKWGG